jgi:hypothetical protein
MWPGIVVLKDCVVLAQEWHYHWLQDFVDIALTSQVPSDDDEICT